MSPKKHVLIALISLVLIAILSSGCISTLVPTPLPAELRKFNSTSEIEQYVRTSMAEDRQENYAVPVPMAVGNSRTDQVSKSGEAAETSSWTGTPGYSQTNVQVAGVDEPDIVKNDARYIYAISGSTLAIVDAYPAERASVVSKIEIPDTPKDLFVSGDRLVLFTEGWETTGYDDAYSAQEMIQGIARIAPVPPIRTAPSTHAIVYDIGDRANPRVEKDYTIDGNYLDARMIGSTVYMITREQISPYSSGPIIVPALHEGAKTIVQPDVWYFDNPEHQYTFTTITALDAATGNERDAQTYLLGSGNVLYVSRDAMYVSYQKYHPVVYPLRGGIVEPQTVGWATGSGAGSAAGIPSNFNSLSEEERQAIVSDLQGSGEDALRRQEADQTTTVIHKIAIHDGSIRYVARGEVPGTVKNQFAMDEYEGNLRVATTSNVYAQTGSYTYNSVYVLNGQMETIGFLTHLAVQESIYSTRFVGDRLYMVTFRRIDPFFVIDLSSPEHPKVLGKLKIPGYSDYLHPYDATHVIGIGKETEANDWGGVSTSGLKLALFDVSDVSNPRQIDKVQIGDAGSDSAALTDHHAFLFDKGKNLLSIPVRAVTAVPVRKGDSSTSQPQVWYGAYVFSLTPETGFVLKGTVEHGTGDSGYYWYGSSPYEVKRSLYIGDVLYTISSRQIKANSLGNMNTTISTILLPGGGDVYYPMLRGAVE
jgi:inhibitor of cysteine peptidase